MARSRLFLQAFICSVISLLAAIDAQARQWQPQPPMPRVYQPTCLTTRSETLVNLLHDESSAFAHGLAGAYTGKGVMVGVIDVGIEYNHLNFRDPETGHSRLCAAVLYRPEEGAASDVREYYVESVQLDTLTTDTPENSHGTHTSGIAAGSFPALGQQGMAPESQLMLCGTSTLTDERIIDALGLIFARADELDVPCVINLSIGSPVDWKDGLTPFCLACDSLTEGGTAPGRIIVVSAGNDGAKRFAFDGEVTDDLPRYALLQPATWQGQKAYLNPNIDLYCSDDQPLALDYVLFDTLRQTFAPCPFEQHLLDTLEAGHNLRRHLCLDADTCLMGNYPNQLLAARISGTKGSAYTGYYINDVSVNYAVLPGPDDSWLPGTTRHSISDLCCTESVISVGAYSAVDTVQNIFGHRLAALAPSGEVCSFSSYGESWQGIAKPDVVCPGASVVSSFSSYWDEKVSYYYTSGRYLDSPMMYAVTPQEQDEPWFLPDQPDRTYYWIHSVGTSQSSPVMAGIIALWLEACPSLSVADVRDILQRTSRFDSQCLAAPEGVMQAGSGKADALAGMRDAENRAVGIRQIPAVKPRPTGLSFDLMGRPVKSDGRTRIFITY